MRLARLILISLMGLAAVACIARPAETFTPLDAAGLIEALRASGAEVELGEDVEQVFFSVPGGIIRLNGQDVQVFEYADAAARQADADLISPDGSTIGTTMVTWMDRPNFWARDRLIVLYVGQDGEIIEMLTEVLGDPLTQN